MQNYLFNSKEITKRWNECRHDLEIELCAELSYTKVQIVGWMKTDTRDSAIENINYKFLELIPHTSIDEKDTILKNWYKDSSKLAKAQRVVNSVSKKYGFQFIGLETVQETVPVFVVKLGEN